MMSDVATIKEDASAQLKALLAAQEGPAPVAATAGSADLAQQVQLAIDAVQAGLVERETEARARPRAPTSSAPMHAHALPSPAC